MTWEDLLTKVRDRKTFEADTLWTETGDLLVALAEQVEENRQAIARLEMGNMVMPTEVIIDADPTDIEVIELPPAAQGEGTEELVADKAPPHNQWYRQGYDADCYD